jgi:hypothetical protein
VRERKFEDFKPLFARYKFITPPNGDIEATLQQGGLLVLAGQALAYEHKDAGLGAHAPVDEVLAACRATAA